MRHRTLVRWKWRLMLAALLLCPVLFWGSLLSVLFWALCPQTCEYSAPEGGRYGD